MLINMSSGPEYRFLMSVLDCENAYKKIDALKLHKCRLFVNKCKHSKRVTLVSYPLALDW